MHKRKARKKKMGAQLQTDKTGTLRHRDRGDPQLHGGTEHKDKAGLSTRGQGCIWVSYSCPWLAKPRAQPCFNYTVINSTVTPSLTFTPLTLLAFQKLLGQLMITSHFHPYPYSPTSHQSPPTSRHYLAGRQHISLWSFTALQW